MKIGKRMKSLRKERKMTLKELSKKSGVQIATLSRMENNIMTGTLESHIAICNAFRISLSDFYREVEESHKSVSLSKQKEKRESYVHQKKASTEILSTKVMDKKMMPLLMAIQKGGETHKEENKVGTEKFIYVLEGKLLAKIGKEEYPMSKGDSLYFDASLPHIFRNTSKIEARVICVMTPPAF